MGNLVDNCIQRNSARWTLTHSEAVALPESDEGDLDVEFDDDDKDDDGMESCGKATSSSIHPSDHLPTVKW